MVNLSLCPSQFSLFSSSISADHYTTRNLGRQPFQSRCTKSHQSSHAPTGAAQSLGYSTTMVRLLLLGHPSIDLPTVTPTPSTAAHSDVPLALTRLSKIGACISRTQASPTLPCVHHTHQGLQTATSSLVPCQSYCHVSPSDTSTPLLRQSCVDY